MTVTSPSSTTSTGLAFTGADIAGMTIFAFAAVGVGSAIVYGSRRSRRRSIGA